MSTLRGEEKNANGESSSKGSTYSSTYLNLSFSPGEIDLMEVQKVVEVKARPAQLKGWLKKQGEDLFKVYKRR